MIALRRSGRLLFVLALSLAYVGWHTSNAFAKPKGGDDDDDSGDDSGDSDKGDSEGGDDDDNASDDKDQPPVTAGGLFTLNTYPVNELKRPLTLSKGIIQLRAGLGTDLSAKGAFNSFGLNIEGAYGYSDNFMLIGGITDAYNFKQFGFYFGFEGALAYDLLDIRIAANVHRNAVPIYGNFCDPPAYPGEKTAGDGMCHDAMDGSGPVNTTQTVDTLPSGTFQAGGTQFSVDIGFPLRYAIVPQFAVVALQTLMSIDFNAVKVDHVLVTPVADAMPGQASVTTQIVGNSAKPDLKPSIGLATNPIPELAITVFAQLRIPDFDTAAGAFQVPVTARLQASPSNKLDFGLEFTLLNVAPPTGQSPIDNRFLSIYSQARF